MYAITNIKNIIEIGLTEPSTSFWNTERGLCFASVFCGGGSRIICNSYRSVHGYIYNHNLLIRGAGFFTRYLELCNMARRRVAGAAVKTAGKTSSGKLTMRG
jgi:hypothetical protein